VETAIAPGNKHKDGPWTTVDVTLLRGHALGRPPKSEFWGYLLFAHPAAGNYFTWSSTSSEAPQFFFFLGIAAPLLAAKPSARRNHLLFFFLFLFLQGWRNSRHLETAVLGGFAIFRCYDACGDRRQTFEQQQQQQQQQQQPFPLLLGKEALCLQRPRYGFADFVQRGSKSGNDNDV